MKKYFIIIALGLAMSFSSLLAKSSTKIGGGLAYGTGWEEVAIQIGADIDINKLWSIAPDFKYYLTDEFYTVWELNANAHYVISDKDKLSFYLLGGLNFAHYSSEGTTVDLGPFGGVVDTGVSNSEIGLNLGVGMDINVGGFFITPEVKYVLSSYDQLVIGASVMFPI